MITPYVFIAAPAQFCRPDPLATLDGFRAFHRHDHTDYTARHWEDISAKAQRVHDQIRGTDPEGARFLRVHFDAIR